jgi:hypothetical protein
MRENLSPRGIALEFQGPEQIAAADYADQEGPSTLVFDDRKTAQSRREHAIYRGSDQVIGRERHDPTPHDVIDVLRPQDARLGQETLRVMADDAQEVELGDNADQGIPLVDDRKGVETAEDEEMLESAHRRLEPDRSRSRRHDISYHHGRDVPDHGSPSSTSICDDRAIRREYGSPPDGWDAFPGVTG